MSGPGGTLWSDNAVNGVINVITLSAKNTIGLLAAAIAPIAGKKERGLAARHGAALGGDEIPACEVRANAELETWCCVVER